MEPEVRERFERIEATLALSAEHHRRAMEEVDRRMLAGEKRMAAFDQRMLAAEKRMDRADKQIESTRKLVAAGIGMITRLAAESRQNRADNKALKAEMRAFIKSQGNGRGGTNGRGRH